MADYFARLTGSCYFEKTRHGLVLYVQVEEPVRPPIDTPDGMIFSTLSYRKATLEDVEVLRQQSKFIV